MSRKVTHVKFHASVFSKSFGNLGDTLPSLSKTIPNLQLNRLENGDLEISDGARCCIVPFTNVVIMDCAPAEEKSKKESK